VTGVTTSFGVLGVFLLMVPECACIPIPSEVTLLFSGVAVREGVDELPARGPRRAWHAISSVVGRVLLVVGVATLVLTFVRTAK
jgi:hypothetical protein